MKVTVHGPGITYQYSEAGEFDTARGSGFKIELDPDQVDEDAANIPQLWQTAFLANWSTSKRDPHQVLLRLQEILRETLVKLPDNEFVLKDAWLLGLIPTASAQTSYAVHVGAFRRKMAEERAGQDPPAGTGPAARSCGSPRAEDQSHLRRGR